MDSESEPQHSQLNLLQRVVWTFKSITVEPCMLFYFLGTFFLYTAFQPLVYEKTCYEYLDGTNLTCSELTQSNSTIAAQIQSDSSGWVALNTLLFSLPSILMDILLGSWSDFFGRKLPIFLPSVGAVIATIVYILMNEIPEMSVSWLLASSLVSGLFGGPTGAVASSFSYISVITDSKQRTTRFAILESMSYIAGSVAPFVAGRIFQVSNKTTIFALSGSFYVLNIIYTLFLSEPKQDSSVVRKPTLLSLFSLAHLKKSVVILVKARPARLRILTLLLMTCLIQALITGELDILFLFVQQIGLTWAGGDVGAQFSYIFGGKYSLSSAALLFLLPIFKKFGLPDPWACGIGMISSITGFIIFGLSASTAPIIVSMFIGCMGTWAIATSRSLLSQTVPEEEIGKLFGVVAVIGDIALVVGAQFYNHLYPALYPYHPGGVYFTSASMLILPLILLIGIEIYSGKHKPRDCEKQEGAEKGLDNTGYQSEHEVINFFSRKTKVLLGRIENS